MRANNLKQPLELFFKCRDGSVATLVAVMRPAVLGMGAVAFDMGYWYFDRRSMQTAADTAAVAAAWEYVDGGTEAEAIAVGKLAAATNGYSESDGFTVSVALDTTTGQATATVGGAGVRFTSAMILEPDDIRVSTTAVAGGREIEPVCLLALQEFGTGIAASDGSNVADIYATNFSVRANSSHRKVIDTNGVSALIDASTVCVNYAEPPTGQDYPNTTPPIYSCAPIIEPFKSQLAPEWSGLSIDCLTEMAEMGLGKGKSIQVNDGEVIESGCYIGKNLNITGDASFETGGVFFLYDTEISVTGGNNHVTGDEVTIFLYGNSALKMAGAQTLELSAKPSTDADYPNILIAADVDNAEAITGTSDTTIGGSASADLAGIICLPRQDIDVSGGGGLTMTEGLLIARTIKRSGNGGLTITAPYNNTPKRELVMLLQ